MISRFILLSFALLCLCTDAVAQTGGNNSQNTLLPEINPQDIEIRSEFRARFPGLRRQPILGFNPKPRVFQVDPNRMPFMESRDEAVASVAITQLDRPEPPARSIIQAPLRRSIYAKAGFGSFTTPEFQGYFFQGLNQKSSISGNVDFSSSDGHLDAQESSFRFLDGDIRFTSKIKRDLKIESSVGFLSDFNRLYNLEPIYQDIIGSTANKDYLGFSGSVSVQQIKNSLEGLTGDLSFRYFESSLEAGGIAQFEGSVSEQLLDVNISKYWPGNRLYETFKISGDVTVGNYESVGTASQSVLLTHLSGEYKKLINFNIHITGSAGISYVSDGVSNRIYFTPKALITYNLKDAILIKGGLSGNANFKSLQEHHQVNRFLNAKSILRHSYNSSVFGEVAFQILEGNRLYSGINYAITKNYAYYDRESETRIGTEYQLFYQINYDKATEIEFYGGVTQQFKPDQFWLDVRFYARRPSLENAGDIPFEERLGLTTSVSYKPLDELLIHAWVDFIGSRQAPSVGEELDPFTVASFTAEYEITPKFGVYTKVLNILGQKYELWDGYEERPFQIFGGINLKL